MARHMIGGLMLLVLLFGSLPAQAGQGMYSTYAMDSFKKATDQSRVLFFYAGWCPFCRASDAKLKSLTLPDNVAVYKVDFDKATDLKTKYGVTKQDTFVLVDAKGEKLAEWMGLQNALNAKFMARAEK